MKPRLTIVAILGMLATAGAAAAGERLVAEFFPQRHIDLQGAWELPRFTGDPEIDSRMVARVRELELRLFIPPAFTSPPKQVSISLVLPAQIPGMRGTGGFEMSWTTRGRFREGSVRPGERALLFQGLADAPVLVDFMSFTYVIDAREMVGTLRVEPVYEIEFN